MPTLYDAVVGFAERWPDKLALISELDGTRTYGELADRGGRFGHALVHEFGFTVGDRALSWMVNRPEYLDVSLGMQATGTAGVPTNPEWTDGELEYVLRHSGARLLLTESDLGDRAVALAEQVDTCRAVISVDAPVEGALFLPDVLAAQPDTPALPEVEGFVEGSVLYTSGTTTGRPKAVPFSPELFGGSAVPYEEMFGLTHQDRFIFVTPLFHGNGMGACMAALSRGASAVFQRRFSATRFWGLVDRYRPTIFMTLVPIVNILMGRPPTALDRSHSLRLIVALGSAPVYDQIEERYGVPCADWYGMTEAGMGTYTRLGEERRLGSVGKPFEGTVMKVFREDGTEADAGETGEICFARGTIGFQGYIDDEEATDKAIRGDWFRTGDLGYVDEDGYLYFVDRDKDIVRRGGENISSLEVESVLRTHPAVGDVAVVAKPDDVLGETVAVFVVVADGAEPPTLDELRDHGLGQLGGYKLPETLVIVDELPRTGTGKIQKFELRSRL